jgi:hypothetical protein
MNKPVGFGSKEDMDYVAVEINGKIKVYKGLSVDKCASVEEHYAHIVSEGEEVSTKEARLIHPNHSSKPEKKVAKT